MQQKPWQDNVHRPQQKQPKQWHRPVSCFAGDACFFSICFNGDWGRDMQRLPIYDVEPDRRFAIL